MMRGLAIATGCAYIFLGLSVAISPSWIISAVDWESRQGLFVAALIRVVVGLVLLLSARTSRYPKVFRIFGAIALLGALALPFAPVEIFARYIHWWMVDNVELFQLCTSTGAILFGSFMVYAAGPSVTPPGSES